MTAGIHALPVQRGGLSTLRGGPVNMNPEGRGRGGRAVVPGDPDDPERKRKE